MQPIMLSAFNPGPMTGEGNRTWLLAARNAVLIDAGVGDPRHLDLLEHTLDAADTTLGTVVVTHAHPDHMGGAPAIRSRWPGARIVKYPWPEADARYGIAAERLADGDCIMAGDEPLVVVHTPGHSPDHVCLWHEASRTLFGADLLIDAGTVVIPASRGGRLSEYLRSLERVLALNPRVVLPAHGALIESPADLIRGTLAHRRRREAQVLEALARGPATSANLVALIYDAVPESLQRLAEESVGAHLVKLVEEGRVVVDDDRYSLNP